MIRFRRAATGRRPAVVALTATVALTAAVALVAGGAAQARTPVTQVFAQLPGGPWVVNEPVAVAGDVLTIGANGSVSLRDEAPNDWSGTSDNNLGWTVEARMRLDASVTADCVEEPAQLWAADHTMGVTIGFGRGEVCLTYPDRVHHAMDTQSAFHTYTVQVRRDRVRLSVDGRQVMEHTLSWGGGMTPTLMAASHQGVSHWRYLRYDTTPSLPRCTLTGTPGPDRLVGSRRADVICGGGGADVLIGGGGDDVLIGGLDADVLIGGGGRDTLLGGHGDDVLYGGAQDDTLYGGVGADRFPAAGPGDGADVISGGYDVDTADYSARGSATPLTISLNGLADDGAYSERDLVGLYRWDRDGGSDVESVLGGAGDDTLTGDILANRLDGGTGADVLRGLGGRDTLLGVDGAPVDSLDGGDATDDCTGDPGDILTSCNDLPCPSRSMTMPPWPPSGSSSPKPSTGVPPIPASPSQTPIPTMSTQSPMPSPSCRR